MRPPMTPPVVLVLALSCLRRRRPPARRRLQVDYGISLGGLPLGTADLTTTVEGARYTVKSGAKLTGLAGMLTGGKGAAAAAGALSRRPAAAVVLRGHLALLEGPADRAHGA